MNTRTHNHVSALLFAGLFVLKFGFTSAPNIQLNELEQIIDKTITQYEQSFKQLLDKLPTQEGYLAPLLVSCDYVLLNHAVEKITTKKQPVYLFIQRKGNSIITAVTNLFKTIFNAHGNKTTSKLSDLEEMTFLSVVKNLQKTGFFVPENKGIASLIDLTTVEDILKNSVIYIKNNLKNSSDLNPYITIITELNGLLMDFFGQNYDKENLVKRSLQELARSKKSLVNQALDANTRIGAGIIQTGAHVMGAIGTSIADLAQIKALEDDLIKKIKAHYEKSKTSYNKKVQEKEETLSDQDKYLARLFVQFDFNSLYLYEKSEDRPHTEKIIGFLMGDKIKTKINSYITVFVMRIIRSLETLIDHGYKYHIENIYDPETGKSSVSITDKEKIAFQHLYEFAKDVLAYQMAIKEVDQGLSTLEKLSNKINEYIQKCIKSDVSYDKKKAFLEPLYQMAYFFQCIKLNRFDYATILSGIKAHISDVTVPNDPDLNQKYIPFILSFAKRTLPGSFAKRTLPGPILWFFMWGIGLVGVITQYSLLYVLKKIYHDVTVDETKAQGQQLKEIVTEVAQRKLKEKIPLTQVSVIQRAADHVAKRSVEKVLTSLENQYNETFSPTPYEGSGLITKTNPAKGQEKENVPAPTPSTTQAPAPQKSFWDRMQNYIASWFSWMWA